MNDMTRVTRDMLHRLPKTDLHVHLDGSLRPQTMLELADAADIALPASDADALGEYMHVREGRDLVDYLARFDITLALMQTAGAIERIAYELAEDCALENIRYTEIRFCPALNTRGGLSHADVVEAALRGLRRAEADHEITTALIVCGLRNLPVQTSIEMAELAVDFRDRGVVAFDLAGAERGHPPIDHQPAFQIAADANMAITIHAGEAFGPASIHQAIHNCNARRIGHGTRLWEDPDLLAFVNDFRIPIEVCLTSNIQTRAAPSLEDHPLRIFYDQGLVVTLNTDNRLMSATTMTDEFLRAHEALGFTWDQLCELAVMGFESAFLPYRDKAALVAAVSAEIDAAAAPAPAPEAS
ncbi:MAG TPA: adenosine deaminase [Longimicrobiales bacterium]|nr:adenosine deaminase [Longimicrobiales bacterium]